jgi:hypothetical protein
MTRAMSALCQKRTSAASFDHLVSGSEQRRRNGKAKCLCRAANLEAQCPLCAKSRLMHRNKSF